MGKERLKVAVITNIIPPYREHFYDMILNNEIYDIEVFCQSKVAGSNIRSSHRKYGRKVHILKSISPFKNEKLVFQFLPVLKLAKEFDILVVDGNLRNLTQAIASTVFKLFEKKIIIWSNVYTFGGAKHKQTLRLKWWKMFDNFLMYTEKDVEELVLMGFQDKNIMSINNGLNQNLIEKEIMRWDEDALKKFKKKHTITSENIIISSGRVNKVNEHVLVVEAIKEVKKAIPDILWIVIGNGSELENLKHLIRENDLTENVRLLGEIYEEEKKCPWFLISKAFIHPGPIGLSLFNAFGYSLPVITHEKPDYHGPEFSLFEENKTGRLFQYGNSADLALKIKNMLRNEEQAEEIRRYVYNIVSSGNNTDIMASRFLKMLNSVQ